MTGNRRSLLATLALVVACASEPPIGPHGLPTRMFDFPEAPRVYTARSVSEIDRAVQEFQPIIGRYPPKFRDEAHREAVYEAWSDILLSAEALRSDPPEEAHLYLLAELYRQGHNLDVRGAAQQADANLTQCQSLYPRSRPCNLSASFFYLSVAPTEESLAKAARSLATLRDVASPELDEDAEAGFVFLHLYRRDVEQTRAHLERYLELFPDSSRAVYFRKMRDNLGQDIEVREW